MYPIHRILVAIKDPRARQFPAMGKAAQLARALDAEVCLFHGITEPVYLDVVRVNGGSLPELEQQGSATHRKRLENLAKGLRHRGIKVTTAVEWDYPAHEAVIRAATRFDADLIVVECHRGAHLAPWLLHFTDWELLRNSAVPVLLVKNRRPYHRSKVLAAVDPTHSYAKPTNLDDEILRYGSTIADALRGALHAVHAYNPLLVGMTPSELTAPNGIAKAQAEAAAHARAALDPKLDSIGMARARRHIVDGFAVDVIQRVARDIRAEIVVMGAISRSGLKRLFIGNTAERMLDRMTCDVLIVKPRQFSNGIARVARGPQVIAAPLLPGGLSAGY
jgi:universal stress protein E